MTWLLSLACSPDRRAIMHNKAHAPASLVLNAQRLAPTVALQAKEPEHFLEAACGLAGFDPRRGADSLLAPSRAVLATRHGTIDVS